MRNPFRIAARVCLGLFCALALGCGGGSSGTGTDVRSVTGRIIDSQERPIADARITIVETGESTNSDSQGLFLLETTSREAQLELLIEKSETTSRVPVEFLDNGSTDVTLTITIDPVTGSGDVKGLDVRVKIVGNCDFYFENTRPIRQGNAIPSGTICPLQVSIRSTRGGLPRRTFSLEYRGCSDADPWKLVGTSETGPEGTKRLEFRYFDDPTHCVYRVLLPLNDNEFRPVEFLILSSTFQNTRTP